MGRRKTTPDEIKSALELKAQGTTFEDIAEALNRSTYWVYMHTKDFTATKGNKSEHTTIKNVVVEEKKRLKRQKQLMRKITCIPMAVGGLNTNKM